MIGIIYKYTSPSDKCYIGQTIRETIRKCGHKYAALKENAQTKFARAIRKYGWENFEYEVLFTIDNDDKKRVKEKLDFMERYYIRKFDSYNNGYNRTIGGSSLRGKNHPRALINEDIVWKIRELYGQKVKRSSVFSVFQNDEIEVLGIYLKYKDKLRGEYRSKGDINVATLLKIFSG